MKKTVRIIILILLLFFLGVALSFCYLKFGIKKLRVSEEAAMKAQGIMILIESTDKPTGLSNLVNQMKEKNIYGLLMVTPEFTQANCEEIKNVLSSGNIEIVASNVSSPFWDMPYAEQKTRIVQMLDGIEKCTGKKPRIISSRYMASDMNTVKVAEELGIPYITARGTTGTKATVYQPEGYHVKILSVSNITLVPFAYGSLCDYSFYERAGTPKDMEEELMRSIEPLTATEKVRFGEYNRITPVSHTYIGGDLKSWNDMWLDFWDKANLNWVSLDEFTAKPDWTIPLWQIPINKNNPYTEEKIRPLVPYEEEEKVQNPCAVINTENTQPVSQEALADNKIVAFHNGQGPMCLEFLEFIKTLNYPVEQYLVGDENFNNVLASYKNNFNKSTGVSEDFGYYPIIFIKGKAFSGFNEEVKAAILKAISE